VPLTWEPLLAVPGLRPEFDAAYPAPDEPHVVTFLLADRDNPVSVLSTVMAARTNVRTAREVMPREAWQAINDLYLYVTSHHTDGVGRRSRGRFLERVIGEIQRFASIVSSTMSARSPAHAPAPMPLATLGALPWGQCRRVRLVSIDSLPGAGGPTQRALPGLRRCAAPGWLAGPGPGGCWR
jgi:hypothetical protein